MHGRVFVGALATLLIAGPTVGCNEKKAVKKPPAKEVGGAWSHRFLDQIPKRVAEGRALYANCAPCHGKAGEGRAGIGPALNSESFLAAAGDQFLIDTIVKGRKGTTMTPWIDSLTPDQVKSLVVFMRSWAPVQAAALDESPLAGDAASGGKIFERVCSGCHGRSGSGYQESANGTGIGRKAFLDVVPNGFLRYIISKGKTGTMMRSFVESKGSKIAVANLKPQQIEDVIAYLRKQAW